MSLINKALIATLFFSSIPAFAIPFHANEKLTYSIDWKMGFKFSAGKVTTIIQGPIADKDGNVIYPISAVGRSSGMANSFHPTAYTITSNFDQGYFSRNFEMHGKENGNRYDQVQKLDYQAHETLFSEKTLSEKTPTAAPTTRNLKLSLQSATQDALSALYYLRVANLPAEGQEVEFPVAFNGDNFVTRLKGEGSEMVKVGGKKVEADVYHVDFYLKGQLDNGNSRVWVSRDAQRVLLKLETKISIGAIWVTLDSIQ